jgi:hypothetical protein
MKFKIIYPLAAILFLIGCESAEEIEAREEAATRAAMSSCEDTMTSNITRSCSSDPAFAYCSLNNDSSQILGSGCTSKIKNLSYTEQVKMCTSESLRQVNYACAIEVYGCAAVTGDINC